MSSVSAERGNPIVAILHWIAAVLLIASLGWGLHPVLGVVGIIVVTALVAEIHGYLGPAIAWTAGLLRRARP